MKEIKEILSPLQKIISMATGVPQERVILGNQGHAAPSGNSPYISFLPTPLRVYGRPSDSYQDIAPIEPYSETLGDNWTDLNKKLTTNWIILVSVTVFNEGAETIATKIPYATARDDVLFLANNANISLRNVSNVRNVSNLIQAGVQPRYNVDIEMWAQLEISFGVLRVAKVPFVINDQNGNQISKED